MNRNRKVLQTVLVLSSLLVASTSFAQVGAAPESADGTNNAPTKPLANPAVVETTETTTTTVTQEEVPVGAAPESAEKQPFVGLDYAYNRKNASLADNLKWQGSITGVIRTTLTLQQEKSGFNSFGVAHARLGAKGSIYDGMFGFNILFDGSAKLEVQGNNNFTAGVRDAYLTFKPYPFIGAQMGWFIPEFDYEGTASTAARPFAQLSRSTKLRVSSQSSDKLSIGSREAGLMIGAKNYQPWGKNSLGLTYLFTVSNGDSNAAPVNATKPQGDKHFDYYTRFGGSWGQYVSLLAGVRYNRYDYQLTQPVVASPTDKKGSVLGYALDIQGTVYGISYLASMIGVTDNTDIDATDPKAKVNAQTYTLQLQYQLPWYGLQPGIMYSYGDPNTDEAAQNDTSSAFTLGLNWEMDNLPIKTVLNYTLNMTHPKGQEALDYGSVFEFVFQAKW